MRTFLLTLILFTSLGCLSFSGNFAESSQKNYFAYISKAYLKSLPTPESQNKFKPPKNIVNLYSELQKSIRSPHNTKEQVQQFIFDCHNHITAPENKNELADRQFNHLALLAYMQGYLSPPQQTQLAQRLTSFTFEINSTQIDEQSNLWYFTIKEYQAFYDHLQTNNYKYNTPPYAPYTYTCKIQGINLNDQFIQTPSYWKKFDPETKPMSVSSEIISRGYAGISPPENVKLEADKTYKISLVIDITYFANNTNLKLTTRYTTQPTEFTTPTAPTPPTTPEKLTDE
ncbi:hypothetical protein JD969_14695 [Planctomycetota bacterium]|nr:hypothetical protein JD969_14695 [Planctomycetota bacterium]